MGFNSGFKGLIHKFLRSSHLHPCVCTWLQGDWKLL